VLVYVLPTVSRKKKKMIWHIIIFFQLWGTYHYENRIDASLAWELAGIFAASDALDGFEELQA